MTQRPNSPFRIPISLSLALLLIWLLFNATAAAAATLTGTLTRGGQASPQGVSQVPVTLYEATEFTPIALATTTTDRAGRFALTTSRETSESIFFLSAPLGPYISFTTVLGQRLPASATINEITSVAASYSLAQFLRSGRIAGDAFRLKIAAMMSRNIADPVSGAISDVLKTSPNADQTNSLRLTRSLANLLYRCTQDPLVTEILMLSTKDERGRTPSSTTEAFANLARDPAANKSLLYSLAKAHEVYLPALTAEPDQWTITVKVHDTGREDVPFGGAANVAWDSWGYAWVANNVTQGTPNSTKYNVVLRPDGKPADGTGGEPISPFDTGGLLGVGWGVSVDDKDNVWFGNFGWGSPKTSYYPSQTPTDARGAGTGSVSQFRAVDGEPISPDTGYFGPYRVQAIEPDDFGNIWMASLGDTNAIGGSGVWVFRDGNPDDSVHAIVRWQDAPFGIAPIPGQTAAWVTFSGGLAGQNQSSIARYELTATGDLIRTFIEPVGDTLKVVDVDQSGNAWFASQGTDSVFAYGPNGERLGEFGGIGHAWGGIDGPWGLTVDGEGNIWVANFGDLGLNNDFNVGRVSNLCGANPDACPPGLKLGDPISPHTGYTLPSAGEQVLLPNGDPLYGPGAPPSFTPLMRSTSVQVDAAGNLWAINNWKPRFDIDATVNPGGDGIVIFVGLAPPPAR